MNDEWIWIWLAIAVAFALLELVTPVLFFMISFAVGGAVGAVGALFDIGVGVQWAMFLVGSAGALAVLVPIGRRMASATPAGGETSEGSARWVGRTAVVLEEVPGGPTETGLVRLERGQWRAESATDASIPTGAEVEVIAVRGTRLVVARPQQDPSTPTSTGSTE